MTKNKAGQKNKSSICEQTMMVVANIIKLSSLSFVSLGSSSSSSSSRTRLVADHHPEKPSKPSITKDKIASTRKEVLDSNYNDQDENHPRSSQRLQEPEIESKPFSYLLEPQKDNISPSKSTNYVQLRDNINEDIDDRAAAFIRKMHQKNKQKVYNSTSAAFVSKELIN